MPKPIPERLDAMVLVLERLALDAEVIREGSISLADALPEECGIHRRLLLAQIDALERLSIGLGMVQHTAAGIKDDFASQAIGADSSC